MYEESESLLCPQIPALPVPLALSLSLFFDTPMMSSIFDRLIMRRGHSQRASMMVRSSKIDWTAHTHAGTEPSANARRLRVVVRKESLRPSEGDDLRMWRVARVNKQHGGGPGLYACHPSHRNRNRNRQAVMQKRATTQCSHYRLASTNFSSALGN